MWSKTLDPNSPDFGFNDNTVVASSDGIEDCDAIDPSLCLGPDGRLWLTYGTYFGFIRLVELDPKTGKRVEGNQPINIAIDCEATDLIYRDGWYYLLGTHGTCCNGATSTYNIRVGRSKTVTGPFLDNMGIDMLKGGGKLVVAANGRYVGAGHFGRTVLEEGVRNFPAITRPTSTAVAPASWTFARCSGKTAGPLPVKTSRAARLKSSPNAAAMPWNWAWKPFRWAADAVVEAAARGLEVAVHAVARVQSVAPVTPTRWLGGVDRRTG